MVVYVYGQDLRSLGIDRENKEMKKRQTQIEKLGRAGPACSDVPAAWKLSTDCGGRFIIYSHSRGSRLWRPWHGLLMSTIHTLGTSLTPHSLCGLSTWQTEAGGSAVQIHL